MEKDASTTSNHFRIREYIKPRDAQDCYSRVWLDSEIDEIWSSKFLGVDQNGLQRLEFQNPPYVAAMKLGGSPKKYNKAFVVQLNGCDYECSYCFVDRKLNTPEFGNGKYFTAKEIMDQFEVERSRLESSKDVNVIRLTGGESTCLAPELIIDISEEIESRNLSNEVFVRADCNLSTSACLEKVLEDLRKVAQKNNFGIVGCLKSIGNGESGKQDFAETTGAEPMFFSKQFEVLDFVVNKMRADTYLYFVPIILGKIAEYRTRLRECCERLMQINKNLPLRVNILQIRNYSPVKKNMLDAFREGRKLPNYNGEIYEEWFPRFIQEQKTITSIWHNEILPSFYKGNDINRYRCQVPL